MTGRGQRGGSAMRHGARRALFAALTWLPWFAGLASAMPALAASEVKVHHAGGVPADAAALLLAEGEGGTLDVHLATWVEGPASLETRGDDAQITQRVWLWVEVAGEGLLDPGPAAALHLELYLYVLDANGAIAGTLLRVMSVNRPVDGEPPSARGVRYRGHLDLEPGSYRVRLLVRDHRDRGERRVAVRSTPLEVDATEARSSFWVTREPERWLVANEPGVAPPFAFEPSGDPRLHLDRPTTITVVAPENPGNTNGVLRVSAEGASIGATGESLPPASITWHATGVSTPSDRAWRVGRTTLDARTLVPGRYRLQLDSAERSGTVVVPDPGTVRATTSQATVRNTGRRTDGTLALPAGEIETSFRDLLRLLTQRGPAAALPRARQDAQRALAGSAAAVTALVQAQGRVADRLADRDRGSLVPIVDLYLSAYRDHLAARRYLLANHARRLVDMLLDRYAGDTGTRRGRRATSDPGTRTRESLSGDARALLVAVQGGQRDAELLPALARHPEQTDLLLAAAVLSERRGDAAGAVAHLRTLLDLEPAHDEARLRLAINLRRLDRTREAERLLVASCDAPTAWVASLAWQERIRRSLDGGRYDEASSLAGTARDARPQDEQIVLLHAMALDLAGRGRDARSLLDDQLAPSAAGASDGPRYRYSQPRATVGPETGRRWHEAVATRGPALVRALDETRER